MSFLMSFSCQGLQLVDLFCIPPESLCFNHPLCMPSSPLYSWHPESFNGHVYLERSAQISSAPHHTPLFPQRPPLPNFLSCVYFSLSLTLRVHPCPPNIWYWLFHLGLMSQSKAEWKCEGHGWVYWVMAIKTQTLFFMARLHAMPCRLPLEGLSCSKG